MINKVENCHSTYTHTLLIPRAFPKKSSNILCFISFLCFVIYTNHLSRAQDCCKFLFDCRSLECKTESFTLLCTWFTILKYLSSKNGNLLFQKKVVDSKNKNVVINSLTNESKFCFVCLFQHTQLIWTERIFLHWYKLKMIVRPKLRYIESTKMIFFLFLCDELSFTVITVSVRIARPTDSCIAGG